MINWKSRDFAKYSVNQVVLSLVIWGKWVQDIESPKTPRNSPKSAVNTTLQTVVLASRSFYQYHLHIKNFSFFCNIFHKTLKNQRNKSPFFLPSKKRTSKFTVPVRFKSAFIGQKNQNSCFKKPLSSRYNLEEQV